MADPVKDLSGGTISAIQHYWHVILKWKWMASIFFILIVFGVTLYSILIPRSYISRGTIWAEEQLNILPFEDVQRSDSTALSPQSYAQLLQSRALASAVIEKQKLYEREGLLGKKALRGILPPPSDPVFRERLIEEFLDRLYVRPIERTKLIEVAFSDSDPRFASEVLDTVFNEYMEMIIGQKYKASEQAAHFLTAQVDNIRAEIEQGERKLTEYGTSKSIMPLTASEAPTVSRLGEVNKALTEATIDRVNKFDTYSQLKAGTFTDYSGTQTDTPLQRLRNQYTTLSQDYAKRLATLRPEYPEMKRLKSEIDSVKEALQVESNKKTDAAFSDYQAALKKEQSLKDLLDQTRSEAFRTNSNSLVYNSLRIELDNKKALLESLVKRQSETDLSARLKSMETANTWVVDKASLPLNPAFPNKRKNVLIGFLVGLLGGLGLAVGIEHLDNTARTSRDITTTTGFQTLGIIPGFDASDKTGLKAELSRLSAIFKGRSVEPSDGKLVGFGKTLADDRGHRRGKRAGAAVEAGRGTSSNGLELIIARHPNSIQSESIRSLKTTLLVSYPARQYKAVIFTSPLAGEGKSSIVSNLGVSLSQANKRVVIVDADLRRPKQHKIFGTMTSGPGLADYVSSHVEISELAVPTDFPNLFLVGSGARPADPVEVLTSDKMNQLVAQLKRGFDYVLFDTPPLLAVADTIAMGPLAEGVVLVVRAGRTPLPALKQAAQKLDLHKIRCLGVILNDVDLIEQDGYYSRQYYTYTKHV